MAATRKLQGEIDRCLKKVSEGVETFEDIWQKVHNATNSNQKEKYEADLKKEIKKLQRLRDQIKSWIASAEIKDKSTLLDYRKLIETQMERFKVVERETKTKAYSKEGLGAVQKMDPAQKEKEEISTWLVTSIDALNIQLDQFESEIESLVFSCLDELELAGVVPSSATTDSNGTPNSLASTSPHSPTLGLNHSAVTECSSSSVEPNAPSSEKKNKSKMNSEEINASKGMVKPTAVRPLSTTNTSATVPSSSAPSILPQSQQSHNSLMSLNHGTSGASKGSGAPTLPPLSQRGPTPTLPPPHSIPSTPTSNKHPSGSQPAPTTPGNNHYPHAPSTPVAVPSNFAAVASTPPVNLASVNATPPQQSSHKHLNFRGNNHYPHAPSTPVAVPSNFAAVASTPPVNMLKHSIELKQKTLSLKVIAQDVLDKAGLELPPPASDSNSQQQQQQEVYDKSLAPSEAHIPYMLGVVPLGPQPLHKAHHYQYQLVDQAYHHLPTPADSERLRHYITRTPCTTPSYYPQVPLPHSDTLDFFQRLSTESLFFIFYYMEGTKAQYLAAKALKKQSWRFHTKYMMWFQRHEEPKLINEDYEQGTYIYFDNEKWSQRKKEGFTFEYKYLEDRDLN
ncbi:CCR4-NOT transcription complex subunit 3 [Diaphorina citri]|uniref:CCR4-NOT transcription complex subunit 3 n=1 Tax=Diaphorina citri TaxID=121845 RepID=A0A1S3CVV6_DIACI|nr:CCR4-NOT transcription complex subunit 3 [Diaphorina citri]